MAAGYVSPEGREHPTQYPPDELHRILVEDAVRHHATDLPWFVAAIQHIGARRRRGGQTAGEATEEAMKALLDDVESLTGHRRLPVHSGPMQGAKG